MIKCLGIWLDRSMAFSVHLEKVSKRAMGTTTTLSRLLSMVRRKASGEYYQWQIEPCYMRDSHMGERNACGQNQKQINQSTGEDDNNKNNLVLREYLDLSVKTTRTQSSGCQYLLLVLSRNVIQFFDCLLSSFDPLALKLPFFKRFLFFYTQWSLISLQKLTCCLQLWSIAQQFHTLFFFSNLQQFYIVVIFVIPMTDCGLLFHPSKLELMLQSNHVYCNRKQI